MRLLSFRPLAAVFSTLVLAGCTSVFADVRSTWQYATEKQPDAYMNAEQINDFAYSAQYVQREGFPRALLVLGYIDGQGNQAKFSWVSASHETVVTQQGRLIKTDSFEPALLARTNLTNDPLRCIQAEMAKVGGFSTDETCLQPWYSELDMQHGERFYSVPLRSEFSFGEQGSIELPSGHHIATQKVYEHIDIAATTGQAAHQYTNEYWLEADGHIVKSKQYFAPGEPAFYFTQVKWVGRSYE